MHRPRFFRKTYPALRTTEAAETEAKITGLSGLNFNVMGNLLIARSGKKQQGKKED